MIHAYSELYLDSAQQCLGDAVDFALNTVRMTPSFFSMLFTISDVSKQFAAGNPAFIAGMTGPELVEQMQLECGLSPYTEQPVLYLDKGPEYWSGWALAWYQWESGRSFSEILQIVPLQQVLQMYEPYHEMDITRFSEEMEKLILVQKQVSRLAAYRKLLGMSQAELARRAEVPLRQVQLFEQGYRDINKTQGQTLKKLSRALHCNIEALLEPHHLENSALLQAEK